MYKKAFVLLSGGLDSTTCLFQALYDYSQEEDLNDVRTRIEFNYANLSRLDPIPWVEAFSVNYGQRHQKEMEYAKRTCDRLGIAHTILDVGSLLSGSTVMLSRESVGTVDVPDIDYSQIRGISPTYVPFRNGLLLSAITAQAQKYINEWIADEAQRLRAHAGTGLSDEYLRKEATDRARGLVGVYFGAHAEDAAGFAYPDCTFEFTGAMANAINVGSYYTVKLHVPLQWFMKKDVIRRGHELGVRFEDTWSCYKGEELHCGICPTCRSRRNGFIAAGIEDPTEYHQ